MITNFKNSISRVSQLYIFILISPIMVLFPGHAQVKILKKQTIFPLQDNHVHSSSIVELPNGDILSCWFEGSGERNADDVKIKGARLKNGEKQWGKPFLLADTPEFPDCNPVLFLNPKNELFLFWIVIKSNRWEESILKYKKSIRYESYGPPVWSWQDIILLKPGEDFKKSTELKFNELPERGVGWGEYAPLYEKMLVEAAGDKTKRQSGWMTRTKPLLLNSGRILLPLYSDGFNFSIIAYSDDNGNRWKTSDPIVGYGNVQPSLTQRKNGDIVALMRDNGDRPNRVIQSISSDQGENWSTVKDLNIYNPGSSLHTLHLSGEKWLMVNNNLEHGRNILNLNQSLDEGETWESIFEIENSDNQKDSFSYPTIIYSKKKQIHLTYSYSSRGQKTIMHAIIEN
jgi:predicted neuraminidase